MNAPEGAVRRLDAALFECEPPGARAREGWVYRRRSKSPLKPSLSKDC